MSSDVEVVMVRDQSSRSQSSFSALIIDGVHNEVK